MKISNASKKVLASALSAAMVVAFAPTVALGAPTADKIKVSFNPNGGAAAPAGYDDADVNVVTSAATYANVTVPVGATISAEGTLVASGDVNDGKVLYKKDKSGKYAIVLQQF